MFDFADPMPRNDCASRILTSLESGEKSLLEVFRKTALDYSSVRKTMIRLLREGIVDRRLEEKLKPRNGSRHLYRLKSQNSGT